MTARNKLTEAPPYVVESAIKRLGANLHTARVRCQLTIQEVADKIAAGPRVVADAEKGKVTTSIAVYMALLWVYDLLGPVEVIANPAKDVEGITLSIAREGDRARKSKDEDLDNDF